MLARKIVIFRDFEAKYYFFQNASDQIMTPEFFVWIMVYILKIILVFLNNQFSNPENSKCKRKSVKISDFNSQAYIQYIIFNFRLSNNVCTMHYVVCTLIF